MALKLLLDESGGSVPDDGCLVHRARQQQVALLVPLQREDGTLVRAQNVFQLPCTLRVELSSEHLQMAS